MPQTKTAAARARRDFLRCMDPDDLDRWEALARTSSDWDWEEEGSGVGHGAIHDAAKAFYVAELAVRQLALALDDLASAIYCDLPYTHPRANVHPRSYYAKVNEMKAIADELEAQSQPLEGEDDAFGWLAHIHDQLEELAELNGASLTLARMDARRAVESVGQRLGQTIPGAA